MSVQNTTFVTNCYLLHDIRRFNCKALLSSRIIIIIIISSSSSIKVTSSVAVAEWGIADADLISRLIFLDILTLTRA